MDPFVRRFIRSSLAWLAIGGVMGLAMAVWPAGTLGYRPAHVHANLLGFVSMMIFGVAYHVIPRFTGRPLHSARLPGLHLWLANGGLALLFAGWIVRVHAAGPGAALLAAGGTVSGAGAACFIWTIWRTLDAAAKPVAIARKPMPTTR